MNFDWSELAYAGKQPLRALRATFIIAPRALSSARLKQLMQRYLPLGNIILGIAKEPHIAGFEGQPQFAACAPGAVQALVKTISAAPSPHKLYTLQYFQRELPYILEKITFPRVVGINGSWQRSFHLRPEYYLLANRHVPYELLSPFASEAEAQQYADHFTAAHPPAPLPGSTLDDRRLLDLAVAAGRQSFDYTHQTGAVLGKPSSTGYQPLLAAHNTVVPYETYAMHHGSIRELHFSPPNDLNHYDTVHAETMLLLRAGEQRIALDGTSLFITLLPCPTCARMIAASGIREIVYSLDHSDGYALRLFETCGKTVRRIVI